MITFYLSNCTVLREQWQEIKFGDNDTLSAITSSMIHADYLILLTDVDGLYTSNPRKDPDAKLVETVSSISEIRNQGTILVIIHCLLSSELPPS